MNTTLTSHRTSVLVIETENSQGTLLNVAIPEQLFTFTKISSTKGLAEEFKEKDFTVVLLNVEKSTADIKSTISAIREIDSGVPVIVVTDSDNDSLIDKLADDTAAEILFRPVNAKVLLTKLKTISENYSDRKELLNLRQQVAMSYGFDNFVGISRDIAKIKRTLQHVAAENTNVILSGPDGTGKNLLAKIIHYHSARRHSPCLSLDCSAFSHEQIDSELFGAGNKQTIFERADSGTVFIDKIELLNTSIQEKLEMFLRRNRSTTETAETKTDFRLIVSVTTLVYDLVSSGKLNKSLIDCLSAVEFSLPPVSRRIEDIELLTAYFLRMISYENDSPKLNITPAAVEILKRHSWPGNVRELENCLRRAAALCTNNTLDIEDISFLSGTTGDRNISDSITERQAKKASLAESQRFLITEALDANDWNFTHTARQLGIGRTTLWRKIKKYNLTKETSETMESSGVTTDD